MKLWFLILFSVLGIESALATPFWWCGVHFSTLRQRNTSSISNPSSSQPRGKIKAIEKIIENQKFEIIESFLLKILLNNAQDPFIRKYVIEHIFETQKPEVTERVLLNALENTQDSFFQVDLIHALVTISGSQTQSVLIALLKDTNTKFIVNSAALHVLAHLENHPPELLQVITQLSKNNPNKKLKKLARQFLENKKK